MLQVPWWNKRTRLERRLLITALLLTAATAIAIAVAVLVAQSRQQLQQDSQVDARTDLIVSAQIAVVTTHCCRGRFPSHGVLSVRAV